MELGPGTATTEVEAIDKGIVYQPVEIFATSQKSHRLILYAPSDIEGVYSNA
jgi:hypothetical protein